MSDTEEGEAAVHFEGNDNDDNENFSEHVEVNQTHLHEELKYADQIDVENQNNISNTPRKNVSKSKSHIVLIEKIHKEIKNECCDFRTYENLQFITNNLHHFFHIPYFPILSRPGWLLRYGPFASL